MRLKISFPYIMAFFALNMVVGELHEQAHINTGYLICGCYGVRDFSVWTTCEQCISPQWAFLATLAGPLFTYALIWLGAWWISRGPDDTKRLLGFTLLFANLPFARIFTALTGSGDEKMVLQLVAGNASPLLIKLLAALVVVLICLPPMIIAYSRLEGRNRFLWIAGFAIVPLIYGMLYHHMFLNWLLKKGIAGQTYLLGTPLLILLHFLLMLLVLTIFRKGIFQRSKVSAHSA